MTNPTQPKPNLLPAILVYGAPSGPALTQASWFQAEDKEAVKSAAEALKFSVIELQTDADRALAAGAHEGVLKGSGRMIVGSVSSEVYRRIEEHVRRGASAPDPSKPENAAATTTKSVAEQNMNLTGPARLSTTGSDLASAPNPWDALRVGARVLAAYWNEKRESRASGSNRQADRARRIHARMVRRARISGVQDRTEKRRDRASRVPRLGQVTRGKASSENQWDVFHSPSDSTRCRTTRAPTQSPTSGDQAMTSTTMSPAERIRALNDAFRRTFVGGMVVITARR